MDYGKQSRLPVEFWREAKDWDWADRIEYLPRPLRENCREDLQGTLQDWLLLGLQLAHKLPVIDGINLNRSNSRKAAHAQAD